MSDSLRRSTWHYPVPWYGGHPSKEASVADIIEIERALEAVQQFNPLQRVFLTCTGTLQGTLSAWFGGPMEIVVMEQAEQGTLMLGENHIEGMLTFHRIIEMRHSGKCIMRADSTILTEREDVIDLLTKKKLGIGQIMETLGITPEFRLLEADTNAADFWRVYELVGDRVTYRIKETFPQHLYKTGHG